MFLGVVVETRMFDQVNSLDSQSGQVTEGRLPPAGFVVHHQGLQQGYSYVAGPPAMPASHDQGPMARGFAMQPPRPGHGGPLPCVYPPRQWGPPPSYYRGPPPRPPPSFQQGHHQLMPRPGGLQNGQHFPPPPPPPQPGTAGFPQSAPGNPPVIPPHPPLPPAPSSCPTPVASSSMLLSHSMADQNSHKLAGVDRNDDLNRSLCPARSSPSVDSDMEMEDDITQLDEDNVPVLPVGESYTNNLMGSDFDAQKQQDVLQNSEEHFGPSSSPDKVSVEQGDRENYTSPVPKDNKYLVTASAASKYENVFDNPGQGVSGASSSKLHQGHSSDDRLENDDKSSSKNASYQGITQPVTGSDSSSFQKKGNESELHVNLSNFDEAGEVQTAVEGTLSKVQTEAPEVRKIDRFGRLVREGVITSDSDDSGDSRKLNRRRRRRKSRSRSSSRSHSRSPVDSRFRRRKSPQRRRGRRSRSRSWSPRRRRSRSQSPSFLESARFPDRNTRRDRGQMRDCFNFLRGKCYRGASCRYYHVDAERNDGPRIHRNMQQRYLRTTDAHEDTRKSPRRASDHKYETRSSEMLHSREVPFQNVDDTMNAGVANRNESPVKPADVSSLSNSVPEGKSSFSPVKCATSGTFPSSESSVHISASLPHLPSSASFSEAINAPPGIQLGKYPNLAQHGMPPRPPYAAVTNASSSSMTVPSPPLLWPVHNPPGSAEVPLPTSLVQFQPNHLPQNHGGSSQMFLRPYSMRFQDQFQVMSGSGSLSEGVTLPKPVSLAHESPAMGLQSFPSAILPLGGTSTSSFQEQAWPQQHKPLGVVEQSWSQQQKPLGVVEQAWSQQHKPLGIMAHSVAGTIHDSGKDGCTLPPSLVETNQSSNSHDLSIPRGLTHHNPHASTSEEFLNSRFSSIAFQHEKGALFISSDESRQSTSLPKSASSTGYNISVPGAELYDPFDAVRPSLTSMGKADHSKTGEASDDSENLLRLSGSDKPLDAEENREEKCDMDLTSSLGSEEFGETANAEVGDVDNASQSNPHVTKHHHTGEVEIDQDKSPVKRKKSGDSRSTRLFKAALANFVKEVLKPSWRQGNMSKEAFKTVVKKTVDKVSGAMKGRRVPKSKAKIDQYIISSQRKLTKLVMGYVDKYARG